MNVGRDSIRALSLYMHQRAHTREKPCKCNECGKYFSQNASFHSHKRSHKGEKSYISDKHGKGFYHPPVVNIKEVTLKKNHRNFLVKTPALKSVRNFTPERSPVNEMNGSRMLGKYPTLFKIIT